MEITTVILWCWHEASISHFCDDVEKKKQKTYNVMSMDREVLIKAKHWC